MAKTAWTAFPLDAKPYAHAGEAVAMVIAGSIGAAKDAAELQAAVLYRDDNIIALDKPADKSDEIIAAEKRAPGRVMPILQYRFAPGIEKVRHLIRSGLPGRAIDERIDHRARLHTTRSALRRTRRRVGQHAIAFVTRVRQVVDGRRSGDDGGCVAGAGAAIVEDLGADWCCGRAARGPAGSGRRLGVGLVARRRPSCSLGRGCCK